VKQNAKLRAVIVFLTGANQRQTLEKLAADKKLKVPLVVPKGEVEPLLTLYKLDPAAKNTVLVYKDKKVRFNAVEVTPDTFGTVTDAVKAAVS
jgi:hypothetical protein